MQTDGRSPPAPLPAGAGPDQEVLDLAIQCHLLGGIYDKVFPFWCRLFEKDDQRFARCVCALIICLFWNDIGLLSWLLSHRSRAKSHATPHITFKCMHVPAHMHTQRGAGLERKFLAVTRVSWIYLWPLTYICMACFFCIFSSPLK